MSGITIRGANGLALHCPNGVIRDAAEARDGVRVFPIQFGAFGAGEDIYEQLLREMEEGAARKVRR